MKRNKGITLIVLAITIIVLIIIASVGTYSGISALRSSKENAQLSEVRMVQQAVVENYTKYKTTENDMYIRGTAVSYEDVNELLAEMEETPKTIEYTISNPSEKSPYYYYRLSETDLKDMDISQAEGDTFIVNYATGEVINENLKVTRTGKALYVFATEVAIESDLEISMTPERTNSYVQSQQIVINTNADNLSELKYKWTTSLDKPSTSEFTEDVINNKVTTPNGVEGTYYLWVYAKDTSGKETTIVSGGFLIDTIGPTINNTTVTIGEDEELGCTKSTVKIESVQDNGIGTIKEYAYHLGNPGDLEYNSTWKHTGTNSNIIEMRSGDPGPIATNYAYIVAIDSLGNVGPMYRVEISVGEPVKETDTVDKDYIE